MKENKNEQPKELTPEDEKKRIIYTYVAIGCLAVGVVLLALAVGLSYVVYGIGVYLLIASIVSEIAAVSFINSVEKLGKSKLTLALKIISYAVMVAGFAIILFGTVASATLK